MANMIRSSDSLWHSPDTRIILITPPPISEKVRGKELASRDPPQGLDRSLENTKLYADAVKKLGEELAVPVIDMFTPIKDAWKDEDEIKEYLSDGLHLTTAGYTVRPSEQKAICEGRH